MQVKSIEKDMLGNDNVRWISGFSFHGHLRSSPPPYSPYSPCLAAWPNSSSPVRLWSATPSSSLCGSAPPRPAPVQAPCSPHPAQCRRRLLAARPPCVAGEDKGTEKTTSIFWRDSFTSRARSKIRAASAQDDGSVQRKASRRVRLGARSLAVVSRRDDFALSHHLL